MSWQQILMIVMFAANLGIYMVKHGEPREDKYNFWIALIGGAIEMYILYSGGFWEVKP